MPKKCLRWKRHLDETYRFNATELVIISAVPDGQLQAPLRLYEDVSDLRNAGKSTLSCTYHAAQTAHDFLQLLSMLAERAWAGALPMLHFDGHGSKAVMQFPDKSELPWSKTVDVLRDINVATKNNLIVTSGCCFGAWLHDKVLLDDPAPVFGLIGAKESVNAGIVSDDFRTFYQELLRSSEFSHAFNQVDREHFMFVFAVDFLETVLRRYIVEHCMGQGRRRREENLVTQAIDLGKSLNVSRKAIKSGLRKPQAVSLKQMGEHFLMIDRYPENQQRFNFNYATLEQEIRAEALAHR